MRIAILSPIAWRTPPRAYGPWELVASHLTEGLLEAGHDVTLFATADSRTRARLEAVAPAPYEEDKSLDPKVWECLHIAHLMEQADQFDLIHNHFDFLPLTYSRLITTPMVTTIHGFSSPKILPVYRRYNDRVHYISISDADRSAEIDYLATVYNGVDPEQFTFVPRGREYLLFLGRIHRDKGTREAIWIARTVGLPLVIAGIVQDQRYFNRYVEPEIDGTSIRYVGPAGPELRDRLLGNALALLHPINFDEPFGLTVVESMLTGTPVIAIKRGSMGELILDGETGFLVGDAREAADAARRLSRDPDTIDRRRCREWAMERFTVSRMVEGYLRAYEAVL
ncbi:MAG: glycosyltransferase family 4 protein [Alkalispirochaetaceae bacterium]